MGHPSATRQVDPCIAPWDGFLRRSVPFGSWWTGEDARLSINKEKSPALASGAWSCCRRFAGEGARATL